MARAPLRHDHRRERREVERPHDLLGEAQAHLAPRGGGPSAEGARRALAAVPAPGRLEVVRGSPLVVVDASHNPAGMAVTTRALREAFPDTGFVAVVAALADTDVAGMLGELEGLADEVLVTAGASERSLAARELATLAADRFGAPRARVHACLDAALADALERVGDDRGVLVTGSVVTAGEARRLLTR
jgi:dihydrofolate synthase/folylpolyglutamate synthase